MTSLLHSDLVWRMGWTLLHSIWLLLAIGALGGLLLALLSKRSAALRYAVACSGLAAMIISVFVTFAVIEPPNPAISPLKRLHKIESPTPRMPTQNHPLLRQRSHLHRHLIPGLARRSKSPSQQIKRSRSRRFYCPRGWSGW